MKYRMWIALCASFCIAGCVNQGRNTENKLLRENEQRLAQLENSVNELNQQINQLNSRVYEVRTTAGKRTNMTVVPVTAASPASQPSQPTGRVVSPTPAPKKAAAPARPAKPATQAAPASGSLGKSVQASPEPAADSLSLPPAELPPDNIPPVPQGNVPAETLPQTAPQTSIPAANLPEGNHIRVPVSNASPSAPAQTTPIPVPLLPANELSLPPETPEAATPAPKPSSEASQPAPAQTRQRTTAKAPVQGEQAAYNAALAAARSGRSADAIRMFRNFKQQYPNSRYAANADYWIGECLYSQGKYKEALDEFQVVNNSHPAHHKNADALLKAGLTMSKMGDKEGAQEKFRTLISNFPNSDAARRARAMGNP